MNNSRINNSLGNNRVQRTGFTIVEVLIVITIMTVVAVLVIPQIRVINKDRNIREAARLVGSMFNAASNRARVDGTAGVMLLKNQNFQQGGAVYASTTMYRLKEVPSYSGTGFNENFQFFDNAGSWFAEIVLPFQTSLIKQGDRMTVGNEGGTGFTDARIVDVTPIPAVGTPNRLRLQLEILINGVVINPGDVGEPTRTDMLAPNATYPDPPGRMIIPDGGDPSTFMDDRTWRIDRRPRIVESSRVDLPDGYMVDMRYSDYAPNPAQTFSRLQIDNDSVVVIFDENGGIDYIDDEFGHTSSQPFGPLFLYVAEIPVDLSDPIAADPLTRDNNLWVSVNHIYGSINIGYNVAQGIGQPYSQRLFNARQLARKQTALD